MDLSVAILMGAGMECITNGAVEFAAQTGRLDFLSAVLAVLATVIALGAFPIFFFVQRRAESVARAEAARVLAEVNERVEKEAISKIEQLLPMLMQEYRELAKEATRYETGAISLAQEGGGDENPD